MMRYAISYQLNTPGKKYKRLYNTLESMGARRVFKSQWVVKRNSSSATEIKNELRQCIDGNDNLLVVCLDYDWADFNLDIDLDDL